MADFQFVPTLVPALKPGTGLNIRIERGMPEIGKPIHPKLTQVETKKIVKPPKPTIHIPVLIREVPQQLQKPELQYGMGFKDFQQELLPMTSPPTPIRTDPNTVRTGKSLEVGDLIGRIDEAEVRGQNGSYRFLVVISRSPFTVTSLDAQDRWEFVLNPEHFRSLGKVAVEVERRCMARLRN
jgi:hypothetical protein